jgi:hypothetical protein
VVSSDAGRRRRKLPACIAEAWEWGDLKAKIWQSSGTGQVVMTPRVENNRVPCGKVAAHVMSRAVTW